MTEGFIPREYLEKMAGILELPTIQAGDNLKAYPQWDSLAVLSVIAMLDADYHINLTAADLRNIQTSGELWDLVQSKKGLN